MEILALLWKCVVWYITGAVFSRRNTLNGASWGFGSRTKALSNFRVEYSHWEFSSKPNLTVKKVKVEKEQLVL